MMVLRLLALALALAVAGCRDTVEDPVEIASAACTADGAGSCTTDAGACRDWPGYTCCVGKDTGSCACVNDASRCDR